MAYETPDTAPSATTTATECTPDGESGLVKKMETEDCRAQKLEQAYRKRWKEYRDYAAGTQQKTYTVQTNVIAPQLNTVLPLIYARDPEISIRPSKAVDEQRYEDTKSFCDTLQIVSQREWSKANLKKQAKRMVRSGQTVGLGFIKAQLCTDTVKDPIMMTKYNSLQDNLREIDALIAENNEADSPDDLAVKREEIQNQMILVHAGVERQVVKGTVIDMVRADDILVCPDVRELLDYTDAPWIRQNIYMPAEAACKQFSLTKEQVGSAKKYRMNTDSNGATPEAMDENGAPTNTSSEGCDWVCVRERWSLEDGLIYTWLAGCDYWLAPPQPPQYPTSRFYGFFMLGYNWTDDRRYPTSDVSNMMALQDEFSARRSAARTWRERSKPGLVINGQALDSSDTQAMTVSQIGENVVLKSLDPQTPLAAVVMAKPVAQMDLAMLDTSDIMRELEMQAGAQQASTGSVQTAKTATEAEILNQGTQQKGSEKVDSLDDVMSELANYTAQQCVQAYVLEDVIRIAGVGAVWPDLTLDEVQDLLVIDVTAGSMGKPNTSQEQQQWNTILPIINQTMNEISQLEASTMVPSQIPGQPPTLQPPSPDQLALAQAKRALLKETVRRFDDRIDVDQFLPPPPQQQDPAQQMAMGGQPPSGSVPSQISPPGMSPPNAGAPAPDPNAPIPPEIASALSQLPPEDVQRAVSDVASGKSPVTQ